ARFPSIGHAVEAVAAALRRDARPAAVRGYDADEARAHLRGEGARRGALPVAGTVGPPELATVDPDPLAEEGPARGAPPLRPRPAEIWWRRRFGHPVPGPTPPPPALEIAATPDALAAVAAAATAAAAGAGRRARVHVARFDIDGACVFVTLLDGERPDPFGPARAPAAGGAPVGGGRAPASAPSLGARRRELPPRGVLRARGGSAKGGGHDPARRAGGFPAVLPGPRRGSGQGRAGGRRPPARA